MLTGCEKPAFKRRGSHAFAVIPLAVHLAYVLHLMRLSHDFGEANRVDQQRPIKAPLARKRRSVWLA